MESRIRRVIAAFVPVLLAACATAPKPVEQQGDPGLPPIENIQILAINDFHGNLEAWLARGQKVPAVGRTRNLAP